MPPTRIGIIGSGWWAVENHIPVFQSLPGVEVTSICGLNRDHLKAIQQRYGISFTTDNYKELLSRGNLDGVVVSSPHSCHYEHALSALECGLPVLCEKPMAIRSCDAGNLAQTVEATGIPFLVPYGWNYTDFAGIAREAIISGVIGKIEHVLCHMGSPLRDLLTGTGAWVATESLLKPNPDTWSAPGVGGGFAHGQLTHALALLLWITSSEPSQVFSFINASGYRSELSLAISCKFSNGSTGMIGGTGGIPSQSPFQVDVRIFGDRGMILIDVERPRIEIHSSDGTYRSEKTDQKPGSYACVEPLKVFIALLRGESVENRSPASLGKQVVDVLEASLRSASTGRMELVGCHTHR